MIELAKLLSEIYVCLEVSEKLVQFLHYRSLHDKQYWDLHVVQRILSEMHILRIN